MRHGILLIPTFHSTIQNIPLKFFFCWNLTIMNKLKLNFKSGIVILFYTIKTLREYKIDKKIPSFNS